MSQITTHILDTSLGKPAAGVSIYLQAQTDSGWETIGKGLTNSDGRIPDLLPKEMKVSIGNYRMVLRPVTTLNDWRPKAFTQL